MGVITEPQIAEPLRPARAARGAPRTALDDGAPQAQIRRRVTSLVLVTAGMAVLVVALTIWSAIVQDNITRANYLSLANSAIATDRAGLRRIVDDYSHGDDAYRNLAITPDPSWWTDNVRDNLLDNFGVTLAAVYNARNRVYLYRQFDSVMGFDRELFADQEIAEFVNAIRAQYASDPAGKTAFVRLGTSTYMIGGSVIQPFDEGARPDLETVLYEGSVLVFFRPVDDSLIQRISRNFLLPDLRLYSSEQHTGDLLTMPLVSPSGHQLMFLGWRPKWPSRTVLTYVLPALMLLVAIIFYMVHFASRALRRSTDEIVRAHDQAVAAERSKTSMIANVSHEFRTPLNAIIGFSELLSADDAGPVQAQQYSKLINESGTHLQTMIEDVLSMSQMEMGVLTLNEDTFDLIECIRGSMRLVSLHAERNQIPLFLESGRETISMVGDEAKIRQCIANLLSNAVKFSSPGETVVIRVFEDAEALKIQIADQGIGIDPADIETVLRPFGQVESSLARRYAGTGLGLPIAKSLVELHGGFLHIESQPDVGTTVTLGLPKSRIGAGVPHQPRGNAVEVRQPNRAASHG